MDEFAQTRQPDDLFDDDFTPIPESTPQQPPQPQHPPRPKPPPKAPSQKLQQPPPSETIQHPSSTTTTETEPAPDLPIRTKAEIQNPKPTPAVRGDRSHTGGLAKPKLTEDELSARLAAAKLNNAKREEAHRLAEADEASFHRREAQAQQKRREEGQARRLMDQERERNRLRKLAVKGGREWDEGKEEEDEGRERGSNFRRGAYGGVAYDGRESSEQDLEVGDRGYGRGRGRGRGRGERGRGGRGGRGRGRHENGATQPQAVPQAVDFPTLPATKTPSQQPQSQKPSEAVIPPTGEKQSWADQVEKAEPSNPW